MLANQQANYSKLYLGTALSAAGDYWSSYMQTKASGMTCSNISLQKQIPPQPILSQIISTVYKVKLRLRQAPLFLGTWPLKEFLEDQVWLAAGTREQDRGTSMWRWFILSLTCVSEHIKIHPVEWNIKVWKELKTFERLEMLMI